MSADPTSPAQGLNAIIERDRSEVAKGVTAIKKVIASREHLREPGRGPFAWNDERYQQEFGAALDEIDAALKPLVAIAADWSDCPTDPAEIAAARRASSAEPDSRKPWPKEVRDAVADLELRWGISLVSAEHHAEHVGRADRAEAKLCTLSHPAEAERLRAWASKALLWIDGSDIAGAEMETADGSSLSLAQEGYALFGLEPGDREALAAPTAAPSPASAGGALADDVVRLVIAAREVQDEEASADSLHALDSAAEAFASRVPWENEPDDTEQSEPPERICKTPDCIYRTSISINRIELEIIIPGYGEHAQSLSGLFGDNWRGGLLNFPPHERPKALSLHEIYRDYLHEAIEPAIASILKADHAYVAKAGKRPLTTEEHNEGVEAVRAALRTPPQTEGWRFFDHTDEGLKTAEATLSAMPPNAPVTVATALSLVSALRSARRRADECQAARDEALRAQRPSSE